MTVTCGNDSKHKLIIFISKHLLLLSVCDTSTRQPEPCRLHDLTLASLSIFQSKLLFFAQFDMKLNENFQLFYNLQLFYNIFITYEDFSL